MPAAAGTSKAGAVKASGPVAGEESFDLPVAMDSGTVYAYTPVSSAELSGWIAVVSGEVAPVQLQVPGTVARPGPALVVPDGDTPRSAVVATVTPRYVGTGISTKCRKVLWLLAKKCDPT